MFFVPNHFYLAFSIIICNMSNVDNISSLLVCIICLPLSHWRIKKLVKTNNAKKLQESCYLMLIGHLKQLPFCVLYCYVHFIGDRGMWSLFLPSATVWSFVQLPLAVSDCNTDIGQNDFTYVILTENQSNNLSSLNGCTCSSLGSSIAVWGGPNTIPTTKSLHFLVKQFLIFHQSIHLVHSTQHGGCQCCCMLLKLNY